MYNRRLDAMGIPLIYVDLQNSDGFFSKPRCIGMLEEQFLEALSYDGVNKLFQ